MRTQFSKSTKREIASRAGNQCSYLNCTQRTAAADFTDQGVLQAGRAAHIYSASPGGPRGQGGLTSEELKHHQNGIWLCIKHGDLIDSNNGIGHPAEKLFSYKRLHEHRVQKEVLGLCTTIGWIDEFELLDSPLFASGAKVKLGKLNLLFGANSTGKSTFGKFLGGVFKHRHLGYWHEPGKIDLDFIVRFYNPDPVSIRFTVTKDRPIQYEINGSVSSRNSINCNVIIVPEFRDEAYSIRCHRAFLSRLLKMPAWEVEELVASVNSFRYSNLLNYKFISDDQTGSRTLLMDLREKTYPGCNFSSLCTTEKKLVLLDFASAAARKFSKLEPTLLVLDCNFGSGFTEFANFEPQLLAPENHFQTVITFSLDGIDMTDVQWRGWEVIRLYRENEKEKTLFSQDPKMKIDPHKWDLSFLKSCTNENIDFGWNFEQPT